MYRFSPFVPSPQTHSFGRVQQPLFYQIFLAHTVVVKIQNEPMVIIPVKVIEFFVSPCMLAEG
jgi:hypothetical protein